MGHEVIFNPMTVGESALLGVLRKGFLLFHLHGVASEINLSRMHSWR
jgi:hypothetical protein